MKLVKIDIPNKDCRGISLIADDNFPLEIITDIKQYKPTDNFKLQLRITTRNTYTKQQKKITKEFKKQQTLLQAISSMNAKRDEIHTALKDGTIQKERIAKNLSGINGVLNGNSALNDIFDDYINGKKNLLKPKTILSYIGFYNTWLRDSVGKIEIEQITRNDLQNIVHKILAIRAARTAKTLKEVLNPIFKNFFHAGLIAKNPVELLEFKKFDNVKNPEISDIQIKALYVAINKYDVEPFRSIFVWLATGRRVNEILSLKWKDINKEKQTYFILPDSNKAGKKMEYVLDDDLMYIVENIQKRGEYVFPAIKNPKQKMHNDILKRHWIKILTNADLVTVDENGKTIPLVRIHDLRHIVGLKLVNAGVSLEVIASVLGHTTTSITKRYSKVRTETAANAMLQFKELIK